MLMLKNVCVGTVHFFTWSNEHGSISYNVDLSITPLLGIILLCMYCATAKWFPMQIWNSLFWSFDRFEFFVGVDFGVEAA
jgi:hypothetical protein